MDDGVSGAGWRIPRVWMAALSFFHGALVPSYLSDFSDILSRGMLTDRCGGMGMLAVWFFRMLAMPNDRRALRLAASVADRISVKLPVRRSRHQRRQTPAASSRPWRLSSSRFRKPPGVAAALDPVLVDGFVMLHHGLDAAPVRCTNAFHLSRPMRRIEPHSPQGGRLGRCKGAAPVGRI